MPSIVKSPELPRAILPRERLDNRVSPGMLVQKIRGIEYDVVDHDPDAVEVSFGL
jgi:hypothetical protein